MTILSDAATKGAGNKTAPDNPHFESALEAPPAKVWHRTRTGPIARPFAAVGFQRAQLVHCRLLAAEALQMLRYAWSEKMQEHVLDSVITFELAPHGNGCTLLRITQGSFVLRTLASNLNQPGMLPKDSLEKKACFSVKKIRQSKE